MRIPFICPPLTSACYLDCVGDRVCGAIEPISAQLRLLMGLFGPCATILTHLSPFWLSGITKCRSNWPSGTHYDPYPPPHFWGHIFISPLFCGHVACSTNFVSFRISMADYRIVLPFRVPLSHAWSPWPTHRPMLVSLPLLIYIFLYFFLHIYKMF